MDELQGGKVSDDSWSSDTFNKYVCPVAFWTLRNVATAINSITNYTEGVMAQPYLATKRTQCLICGSSLVWYSVHCHYCGITVCLGCSDHPEIPCRKPRELHQLVGMAHVHPLILQYLLDVVSQHQAFPHTTWNSLPGQPATRKCVDCVASNSWAQDAPNALHSTYKSLNSATAADNTPRTVLQTTSCTTLCRLSLQPPFPAELVCGACQNSNGDIKYECRVKYRRTLKVVCEQWTSAGYVSPVDLWEKDSISIPDTITQLYHVECFYKVGDRVQSFFDEVYSETPRWYPGVLTTSIHDPTGDKAGTRFRIDYDDNTAEEVTLPDPTVRLLTDPESNELPLLGDRVRLWSKDDKCWLLGTITSRPEEEEPRRVTRGLSERLALVCTLDNINGCSTTDTTVELTNTAVKKLVEGTSAIKQYYNSLPIEYRTYVPIGQVRHAPIIPWDNGNGCERAQKLFQYGIPCVLRGFPVPTTAADPVKLEKAMNDVETRTICKREGCKYEHLDRSSGRWTAANKFLENHTFWEMITDEHSEHVTRPADCNTGDQGQQQPMGTHIYPPTIRTCWDTPPQHSRHFKLYFPEIWSELEANVSRAIGECTTTLYDSCNNDLYCPTLFSKFEVSRADPTHVNKYAHVDPCDSWALLTWTGGYRSWEGRLTKQEITECSTHQDDEAATSVGAIWTIFPQADYTDVFEYMKDTYGTNNPYIGGGYPLNVDHREQLITTKGLFGWRIQQRVGDFVLVPSRCIYQVQNTASCVQLGGLFGSTYHLAHSWMTLEDSETIPKYFDKQNRVPNVSGMIMCALLNNVPIPDHLKELMEPTTPKDLFSANPSTPTQHEHTITSQRGHATTTKGYPPSSSSPSATIARVQLIHSLKRKHSIPPVLPPVKRMKAVPKPHPPHASATYAAQPQFTRRRRKQVATRKI